MVRGREAEVLFRLVTLEEDCELSLLFYVNYGWGYVQRKAGMKKMGKKEKDQDI